jgi:hypothetical protein
MKAAESIAENRLDFLETHEHRIAMMTYIDSF